MNTPSLTPFVFVSFVSSEKHAMRTTILVLLLAFSSIGAMADVLWKCTAKDGTVLFTTKPDIERFSACKVLVPADQDGNAVLIECTDEGTTYDKTKCKKRNVGRTFSFKGTVFDVKTATILTIRIGTGNYADVSFRENVGDTSRKDQVLKFRGRLDRVGTGILTNHDIKDAILESSSDQSKGVGR